ncbi:MAG: polyphosphate kinase 1 [Fimbriimonadaceae bacterium]|nr:polyphosphate kinase 1 [Fimbriimonadaceae bacterium]
MPERSMPRRRVGRYLNREASWLSFNKRVLLESVNPDNPLLERIKFLAIFESNLDEFYMVRVSGLIEQEEAGVGELSPDGLSASEQLDLIQPIARSLRARAAGIWSQKLRPALRRAGIRLLSWSELRPAEQTELSRRFLAEVFPLCTPLLLHPTTTFPFISNRSLNLLVELDDQGELRVARVKIPPVVPRLFAVPGRKGAHLPVEEMIRGHLDRLFPGVAVGASHLFRVIRDADVEIRELEAGDLIEAVEESLRRRRLGAPVLLEAQKGISPGAMQVLLHGLELEPDDVFSIDGMLGYDFLWSLARSDRPDLKFAPHVPHAVRGLDSPEGLFEEIRRGPFLLHHPYDSFSPVQELVEAVSEDDKVLGVKQTLYRVGSPSPIVQAHLASAEAGRQVAVMVELKARFDESNNLVWARALERAGVHVSYGFAELKTHCKLCVVVRRDEDGIRTYTHVGTGNYNPATSRLYTDLGLFTDDPEIGQDIHNLFNYLTGLSRGIRFKKLLVAPFRLREQIIELIQAETWAARNGRPGRVMIKVNSLVDPGIIDALYEASSAGVEVDLVIRGICCLKPGVPGLSDRIRVVSVVGRFLEHSRIYWFGGDGSPKVYIGSADLMRRNLDRRIEVLAPVESPILQAYLKNQVMESCLRDTKKGWQLRVSGAYVRRKPKAGEAPFSSQDWLMDHPAGRLLELRIPPDIHAEP